MNEFQGTAIIIALFTLRCVMPFVLMLTLAYGMKRLVRHWDSEETGREQVQPSIPLSMAARSAAEPIKSALPCWVMNNCNEKTRSTCPAYISPSLACWVARLRADGQIPTQCAGCALYTGTAIPAAGD